jgi:hypothetical protein
MGEDSGPVDCVVAMHCVYAVDHRYAQPRLQARSLQTKKPSDTIVEQGNVPLRHVESEDITLSAQVLRQVVCVLKVSTAPKSQGSCCRYERLEAACGSSS